MKSISLGIFAFLFFISNLSFAYQTSPYPSDPKLDKLIEDTFFDYGRVSTGKLDRFEDDVVTAMEENYKLLYDYYRTLGEKE